MRCASMIRAGKGSCRPHIAKASRTAWLVEAQASFPDACALVPVHARAGAMRLSCKSYN